MIRARLSVHRRGFVLNATFEAPSKGVTGIFGPSGCGKTTLLRALAGLPPHATGHLDIDGDLWLDTQAGIDMATHKRGVALVFQHAALFPHLSVRGNLKYAWDRRHQGTGSSIKLDELIELTGIGALLDRNTTTLSGGERQRVAIARALASNPRLLLLDEPLSALDQDSRESFQRFLKQLCAKTGVPTFLVSHSVTEIVELSDQVLVMERGNVGDAIPRTRFEELHARRNPGTKTGVP